MSKELCEKLIKETELIYEIIKNNIFNDEDVINEDNKNHVKKWLWNSINFLESEKETKTELYKQILKLEKKVKNTCLDKLSRLIKYFKTSLLLKVNKKNILIYLKLYQLLLRKKIRVISKYKY